MSNLITMKKILILIFLTACVPVMGQNLEGVVSYEYTQYWLKIMDQLPFLSLDQKERMKSTWKNMDGEGQKTKMKLYFTADQSLYTYESEYEGEGGWSRRNRDYAVRRNFKEEKRSELIEMLGRTYLVEDSLKTPKWKILNQLKDIAGHICMKAETEDPVKKQKIVAWFAQDIPVSAGPEQYFGLPGLILELDINDGSAVVTATQIELKDVSKELAVTKKVKAKKIPTSEYEKLIRDHIQTSVKAQENPYWAIRY